MSYQYNENSGSLALDSNNNKWLTFYPWVVITLCAFFLFYKYVLQVSPSVMTKELMGEFNVSGAGLGNLAATFFYAYLVTQLFVGPLLDKYSPRYLTVFAILLCAVGSFCFATTHSLFTAQVSRALMGAGTAFATVSYMKMSAMWFKPNQVAFVDGLLATAAMMGALCGQVPLTILVNHSSWRASVLYFGFFGIFFAVAFLLVVRDKKTKNTESLAASSASKLKFSDFAALFKDKRNWVLTFYSGLAFTPVAVLGGLWGNPFFEVSRNLGSTQAASFTSLIFIGLAIGGPVFGFFAGKLGDAVKVMFVGTAISMVSLSIAIYFTNTPLWFFGFCLFLFGFGTGVFMLCFSYGKQMNPLGLAATVVSIINTGDAFFGSFTEPLIGRVLDYYWDGTVVDGINHFSAASYQVALSLLPIYLFFGLLCLFTLKRMEKR